MVAFTGKESTEMCWNFGSTKDI